MNIARTIIALLVVFLSAPVSAQDMGSMMKKMGDDIKQTMEHAGGAVEERVNHMMGAVRTGDIEVSHAYAREMIPGRDNSAAFMTLTNHGDKQISLQSASCEGFSRVELHTHIKEGEVMRMVEVEQIDIPAKGETQLKPGGLHVMLLDAQRVIKEGDEVAVTLHFSDGSSNTAMMPVQRIQMGGMNHKMSH